MKHDTIVTQPVIETDRFALRPARRSDEGLIALYAGDEEVARNTASIPHPLPPGSIEAFIQRALAVDRMEDVWVMDGGNAMGAEVMGVISLKRVDTGKAEISFWVAPAFWNTGLASEAVAALLAENPLHLDTVYATVFQDNPASARVLTHNGFQYLGDAETFSVARNATVPTWTYSLKLD
ncbi:MAG: GNAT family N-acetyltransferase [Pseudopelagicola sp.]|nr:GNAT family N-acetyltransferase [Pseudopelagicola sp.]